MKEAHVWLQDLAETWRCFMASINLTGEFNNSPCLFSPSNSHGGFNHLFLCIEYCVTHRQIQDCYWGLEALEKARTWESLGKKVRNAWGLQCGTSCKRHQISTRHRSVQEVQMQFAIGVMVIHPQFRISWLWLVFGCNLAKLLNYWNTWSLLQFTCQTPAEAGQANSGSRDRQDLSESPGQKEGLAKNMTEIILEFKTVGLTAL